MARARAGRVWKSATCAVVWVDSRPQGSPGMVSSEQLTPQRIAFCGEQEVTSAGMPSGAPSSFNFKRPSPPEAFESETQFSSLNTHYRQSSSNFGSFYTVGPPLQTNVPSAAYIPSATSRTTGYNSKMTTKPVWSDHIDHIHISFRPLRTPCFHWTTECAGSKMSVASPTCAAAHALQLQD